jgi:parvulin-like peptidyl-prolyl isomerase
MRTESPTFRRAFATMLLVTAAAIAGACADSPGGDDVADVPPGAEEASTAASDAVGGPVVATEGVAPDLPDPAGGTQGDLAARVNGVGIPLEAFRVQAFTAMTHWVNQGLDSGTAEGQEQLQAIRHQVLDDIINQALIDQYATDHGITVTEAEVDESLASYKDEMGGEEAFAKYLAEARTSLEQVREMERRSLIGRKVVTAVVGDVPATALHVHARHILCDTREACQAARDRVAAGEDFASVATEVSSDPTSAERGGDLDWVTKGMLPGPRFEEALFALPAGRLSEVVESEFGFHVIEVLEVDEARALDEQQQFNMHEKMFMDWVAQLRSESDVEILIPDLAEPAAGS